MTILSRYAQGLLMLFDQITSPSDYVLALVHIPKTAGTSLRANLGLLFQPEHRLEFYNGDLANLLKGRQDEVRFVAGHHIRWGVQDSFIRPLLFVTVVRHPLDRYLSLFKELKSNSRNPLHSHVARLDINSFLDFLLESNLPAARAQIGNLQCRLICDRPDAALAAQYVRDYYYLASDIEQIDVLARLIADAYGKPHQDLPRLNVRPDTSELSALSSRARDRLLEVDGEDLKMFLSVRRQFEDLTGSTP